tara:strand:+ start:2975 stop:3160 length:186 start_codon:yes stop_codon:yes gene_type:complete
MNKWQRFAHNNNMNPKQFTSEIIECAQAVLAMELVKKSANNMVITSAQDDGEYKLTFTKIK